MRYLILFDLEQKRYAKKFSSKKAAIDYINFCTSSSDDVIKSIVKENENVYKISFSDNAIARFRIIRRKDGCPLAYYEIELSRIFAKIRNRILAERTMLKNELSEKEREKISTKKFKLRARLNAIALVLSGISIILTGFAIMVLVLTPSDSVWLYVGYMALVIFGIALTLRGSYIFIFPKKQVQKIEKRALDF